MINVTFWLDLLLFGNGHGLGAPYFDQRFYWLTDGNTLMGSGRSLRGRLYTFMPGHGAQLYSFEWRHPLAGERRKLAGREYRPLHSSRKGPRVMVAWSTKLPDGIDVAIAELRQIEALLGKLP